MVLNNASLIRRLHSARHVKLIIEITILGIEHVNYEASDNYGGLKFM